MPYNPGINDISGQIRAQGRMAGGEGLLQGLTGGINILQQKKEEDKQNIAAIKAFESMMGGLEGIADQLDPKLKSAVEQARLAASDTSLSNKQRAQIGQQSLKGLSELLKIGSDVKQQQAVAKQQEMENALRLLQLERGRDSSTETQRNAEAVLQAEIASGKIDPRDQRAMSQRRASLLASGGRDPSEGQVWQHGGPAQDANGNYVGNILINQKTSEVKVVKPGGGAVPVPNGAAQQQGGEPNGVRPTTNTALNRAVLTGEQFLKLQGALTEDEIGLERLTRYNKNVGDARQGLDSVVDRFTTAASTMFGKGKLTSEQMALAMSEGQLQGLIGTVRLETLGGGVLTEQDAMRIIQVLGGDVGALRNKERVKRAIADIYRDKYMRYQRNLKNYNLQVKNKYGADGYEEASATEFDPAFLTSESATGQVDPNKAIADRRATLQKRLDELKGASSTQEKK